MIPRAPAMSECHTAPRISAGVDRPSVLRRLSLHGQPTSTKFHCGCDLPSIGRGIRARSTVHP